MDTVLLLGFLKENIIFILGGLMVVALIFSLVKTFIKWVGLILFIGVVFYFYQGYQSPEPTLTETALQSVYNLADKTAYDTLENMFFSLDTAGTKVDGDKFTIIAGAAMLEGNWNAKKWKLTYGDKKLDIPVTPELVKLIEDVLIPKQ